MTLIYAALLAILACWSLVRASACSQPATNFQIYVNTTGKYGILGAPCKIGACGLFFSVPKTSAKTRYNLTNSGQLVVSVSEQPTKPIGVIAYGHGIDASIEFGTKSRFAGFDGWRPLKCSLKDAGDAPQTCDLNCVYKYGGQLSIGASGDVANYNKAYLGNGAKLHVGTGKIQVKVDFGT